MSDKLYEVQTWKYYDESHQGSEIGLELSFETEAEAWKEYDKITPVNGGKMLMYYKSMEPDAEGVVIAEDWTE